jgi:hypothetical protein
MPSPTAILRFGATQGLLENKLKRSLYGVDTGSQKWFSTSDTLFTEGDPHPDHPNILVEELMLTQDGDEWEYDLTCVGLLGDDKREKGMPDFSDNEDGSFDEGTDAWITTEPTKISKGDAHPDHGTMYAVNVRVAPIVESPSVKIYKVTGQYRGINTAHAYKRSITVNEQIVNPSVPIYVNLPGGWTTPTQDAQMSMPKVVVRDTIVGLIAPPTQLIPGPLTPPDAPAIQSITFTGLETTRHWPSGWKLAAIDNHQTIPNTSLHLYTLVYEYVWEFIPK